MNKQQNSSALKAPFWAPQINYVQCAHIPSPIGGKLTLSYQYLNQKQTLNSSEKGKIYMRVKILA